MPLSTCIFCLFILMGAVSFLLAVFSTKPDPYDKTQGEDVDENNYLSDKLDKYSSWKNNIHQN